MVQQESSYANELEERVKKKEKEFNLKKQRQEIDERIEKLKGTMLEFTKTFGISDYRTEMMMNFYNISLEMKENMKLMEGFNQVSLYINDSLAFIDGSYDLMNGVLDLTNSKKYGLIARIKNNIRMKKSIKSMENRMTQVAKNMANSQKLAMTMSTSIKKAGEMMKKIMNKNNKSNDKSLNKLGKESVELCETSAYKICEEYAKENGVVINNPTNKDTGIISPDEI